MSTNYVALRNQEQTNKCRGLKRTLRRHGGNFTCVIAPAGGAGRGRLLFTSAASHSCSRTRAAESSHRRAHS